MSYVYPIKAGDLLIVDCEELVIRAFTNEYDEDDCLIHGEMIGIPAGETLLCIGFRRCTCLSVKEGDDGIIMAMFLTSRHGIVCEHVHDRSFNIRWGDWYHRTQRIA